MRFLPLLFFFLELWLMIVIGDEVGAFAVIIWLVAMIVIGMNLLRYLGASSMLRAAQNMRSGGAVPAHALTDSLFKALGAVLLIIPGFITDALAIVCFIPLVRRWILKRWMAKMVAKGHFGAASFGAGGFTRSTGNVYEHQGEPQAESTTGNKGVLIDQSPDTSSSQKDKND